MTNLIHWDRLYGVTTITKNDLKIYQTPQFARLNRISLSAVPPWVQTTGVCASRAEHSRGVRFLAKLLCEKKEFKPFRKNLLLAATLHDIGSPPFSHLSEPFQMAITGQTHEQFSRDMIINTKVNKVIKKQGGNLETIISYIEGTKPPISDLINGTIDLDNLDNTLRFGQSMGLIDASKYYDPTIIVKSYLYQDKKLVLDGRYMPAIKSWENCRDQVYQYVYSHENLSPAAMITRALYFAYQEGELKKSFFHKTDDTAVSYLLGCNPKTYKLIKRVSRWKFYKPIFTYQRPINHTKDRLHNMKLGQELSDSLSKILKIKPEDICIDFSFNKGFKKIHLPIIKDKQPQTHTPTQSLNMIINVYLNTDHNFSTNKVTKTITPLLKEKKLIKVD